MERDSSLDLAGELAATHDWWREAGVDCAFVDLAASWFESVHEAGPAKPAMPAPQPAPAPPPRPSIGGDRANWPTDLPAFVQWWLSEPSLDSGGPRPRIAPRGPVGAKVLALVPQPEPDDRERLLSGEQGKLLDSFLRNAGVSESEVFVAAALPRHTPMPDWRDLAAGGLGEVLRHLVELVRPQRAILLGQDVISLMRNDPAQKAAFLLDFNQQRGSVPALAARSLDHMLRVPSARKRLWQDWLDWTDGTP